MYTIQPRIEYSLYSTLYHLNTFAKKVRKMIFVQVVNSCRNEMVKFIEENK